MSLVKNASIKDQLTFEVVPALSAKNVISFFLYAKLYKRERHTAFGLSDEDKKNSSDNFKLHLGVGNSGNVAAVLIVFLLPKQG